MNQTKEVPVFGDPKWIARRERASRLEAKADEWIANRRCSDCGGPVRESAPRTSPRLGELVVTFACSKPHRARMITTYERSFYDTSLARCCDGECPECMEAV